VDWDNTLSSSRCCSADAASTGSALQTPRLSVSTVLTSWPYGLQLNTASPEAGITLVYTRSVEVLPGHSDQLLPGRYPFGVSLRDTPAAASFRRVAGLEIGLNRTMIGVSLGLSEQLTVAPVDAAPQSPGCCCSGQADPRRSGCKCVRETANASGRSLDAAVG
jgi:hypothetical protein